MSKHIARNTLLDFMGKYGTITAYSGHGGIIPQWDRNLLKYYKNREVVFAWVNPVDRHAYIQIK